MTRTWSGPGALHRCGAYAFISVGCIAFALVAGKDLNWDFINYHLYLGYSVFSDRLAQDFFPASVVSYASPYLYVPLYGLIAAGLDDRLIVAALALMGSTALWAVWEIGGLLGVPASGTQRISLPQAYLGTALAAIGPVFFIELGSSFIDLPTAAVVLYGYLFLLRFAMTGSRLQLVLAALLLGAAVGLKQTNAPYALAGIIPVLVAAPPRVAHAAIYASAGILGGAAVMTPWSLGLYREFGNPVFPNLNGIFRSPDFGLEPFSPHYRFIPDSWLDALLRPIWMMSPERGVYAEFPAPDARFFFLFLLIALTLVATLLRNRQLEPGSRQVQPPPAYWSAIAAFAASWCLWLAASGNGRYAMPMVLLAGPLIVASVYSIGTNRRWFVYSLFSVFAVSGVLVALAAVARFEPSPWSGRYLDVSVPTALTARPGVVLSLATQPAAFVVPWLHPRSSFVSVTGMHVLGPDRPGWARVERMLNRGDPIWFLLPAKSDSHGELVAPEQAVFDGATARIGYRVDSTRCESIVLLGLRSNWPDISRPSKGEIRFSVTESPDTFYAVCPGQIDKELRRRYLDQAAMVTPLFEAVEKRCPELFPAGGVTQGLDGVWRRTYASTDSILSYYNKRVRYERFGLNKQRVIGTDADVRKGRFTLDCSRQRDALLTAADFMD